jgi:hypothetical protein
MSRMALESTQPPTQWILGSFSPEIKQPGHESDHSPPSAAKVKTAWSYTSTPPHVFMVWWLVNYGTHFRGVALVKHRDSLCSTQVVLNVAESMVLMA